MKQLIIVDHGYKGYSVFVDEEWIFTSEPHPENTDLDSIRREIDGIVHAFECVYKSLGFDLKVETLDALDNESNRYK